MRSSAARVAHRRLPLSFARRAPPPATRLCRSYLAIADPEWVNALQQFQESHAFIIGILVAIVSRLVINEIRYRIEKPVMDEFGEKVKTQLTPETERLQSGQWATLGLCVLLDLAGDASELVPILGEFTDVGFAPVEAILIKTLFKSNILAGLGFVEEILPFTDVVPTFTISWCLKNLYALATPRSVHHASSSVTLDRAL